MSGFSGRLLQPNFSANLSANQTPTAGPDKILCNTEVYDSNGWYDNATNYRFTPLLPGKYQIDGSVMVFGTSITSIDVYIRKNGADFAREVKQGFTGSNISASLAISALIDMNGTSDYIELYSTAAGSGLLFLAGTAPTRTRFKGVLVSA